MDYESDEIPDCSSCEDAAKDYLQLEKVAGDLSMLIVRLARELRKTIPDNKLSKDAMDYLVKEKLVGSPLREEL